MQIMRCVLLLLLLVSTSQRVSADGPQCFGPTEPGNYVLNENPPKLDQEFCEDGGLYTIDGQYAPFNLLGKYETDNFWTPLRPVGARFWLLRNESFNESGVKLAWIKVKDHLNQESNEKEVVPAPVRHPLSYPSGNPEAISPASSANIWVEGGKPPYRWTIAGEGFELMYEETENPSNIVITDANACGSGDITITGGCGKVTGSIRCNNGHWVVVDLCQAELAPFERGLGVSWIEFCSNHGDPEMTSPTSGLTFTKGFCFSYEEIKYITKCPDAPCNFVVPERNNPAPNYYSVTFFLMKYHWECP